jgi:uncharacterized phage infection (PIP) family protein YhgE
MYLRQKLKHVLRMCGHAVVSTIHDRLDATDHALQEITEQNTHLAGTQTALLQSGIYTAEKLNRIEAELGKCACNTELEAVAARLAKVSADAKAELQELREKVEDLEAHLRHKS